MFRYTVGLGCAAGVMGTTALLASATADAVVQGALLKLESTTSAGGFPAGCRSGPALAGRQHVLEAAVAPLDCGSPVAVEPPQLSPSGSWTEGSFNATLFGTVSDFGRPESEEQFDLAVPESPQHTDRRNSLSSASASPMSKSYHSRSPSWASVGKEVSPSEDQAGQPVIVDEKQQLDTIAVFLNAVEQNDRVAFANVCVDDVKFSDRTFGHLSSSAPPASGCGIAHLLVTLQKNKCIPHRSYLDDVVVEDGKVIIHFSEGVVAECLVMFHLNHDYKITRVVACS